MAYCNISFLAIINPRTKVSVNWIWIHPDYSRKYDFAVIEFKKEVDTSIFTPVCLPRKGQEFHPQEADMLGSKVRS